MTALIVVGIIVAYYALGVLVVKCCNRLIEGGSGAPETSLGFIFFVWTIWPVYILLCIPEICGFIFKPLRPFLLWLGK